jgi:hypothetical protein
MSRSFSSNSEANEATNHSRIASGDAITAITMNESGILNDDTYYSIKTSNYPIGIHHCIFKGNFIFSSGNPHPPHLGPANPFKPIPIALTSRQSRRLLLIYQSGIFVTALSPNRLISSTSSSPPQGSRLFDELNFPKPPTTDILRHTASQYLQNIPRLSATKAHLPTDPLSSPGTGTHSMP